MGKSNGSNLEQEILLKKLLAVGVFAAAVLFALGAEAQEFHGAFGFGTVTAPGVSTDSNGFIFPSVSGGLYPSFSGFFILKHHLGFGGEAAWRAHRAIYTAGGNGGFFQAPYRPIFYDFDAVYGSKFGKKFGGDVMAGIGGGELRFFTPDYTCGFSFCTNYQSSNHFAGHFGATFVITSGEMLLFGLKSTTTLSTTTWNSMARMFPVLPSRSVIHSCRDFERDRYKIFGTTGVSPVVFFDKN